MPSFSHAVMIMAKAPFAGEAKTRLAASLGNEEAAHLYKAFLLDTVEKTGHFGAHAVGIVCPDARHHEALLTLLPESVSVHVQSRSGLMAGIAEAVQIGLNAGARSVLVTEADSPSLPLQHLEECLKELSALTRGIVLGPCDDGGYYLVGAVGLSDGDCRDLFEGEAYHGETICRRTAERARGLGFQVSFGPEWYDVDTLADLQRLVDSLGDDSEDHSLVNLKAALAGVTLPPRQ